jgi:inositol polyphosphate-4-phosphatase
LPGHDDSNPTSKRLLPFQQLLSLWICEEKELVHEIAGLGELKSPWHKCQMAWLENHLNIINTYSQALETLDNYKGNIFYLSETSSG